MAQPDSNHLESSWFDRFMHIYADFSSPNTTIRLHIYSSNTSLILHWLMTLRYLQQCQLVHPIIHLENLLFLFIYACLYAHTKLHKNMITYIFFAHIYLSLTLDFLHDDFKFHSTMSIQLVDQIVLSSCCTVSHFFLFVTDFQTRSTMKITWSSFRKSKDLINPISMSASIMTKSIIPSVHPIYPIKKKIIFNLL